LPIALTCRICHSTRYWDTCRTPLYQYLLAITPLFLNALHRSHQYHSLSMPTDSLPHTCTITAVWLPIARTCRIHYCTQYWDPYRTPFYHYLLTMTPIFFEAQHQDSSLSHHSNTDGLITAYRHCYCNTGTAPSWHQATEHDTNPLSLIPRHRLPHFGYIGRLLYLHGLASGSEVSHGYYRQMRPIGVDPDPRPRLFLTALVCTALGYWIPVYTLTNPWMVDSWEEARGRRSVINVPEAQLRIRMEVWAKVAEFQKTKLLELYSCWV